MKESPEPKETLDCIGLYCPQPLFQTREQIDKIEPGEVLEVLADDPAAEEDLKRFVKRTGHEIILFEKKEGFLRFLIRKKG
ncbi:hypothetical protein AMJ40_07300 [candidate division TA06 bacterium DG_26]|uniref:UPF0033 domain-containing protein n=1 Tax=candidate division TA06 bacterium DG_26 TaxID=1703771 RepID=A0A0S7WEJ8_UNCT6|nr:MAG: hypothetical protein AMJ40_07300 [candidate division TA06 bacterium DG_26]